MNTWPCLIAHSHHGAIIFDGDTVTLTNEDGVKSFPLEEVTHVDVTGPLPFLKGFVRLTAAGKLMYVHFRRRDTRRFALIAAAIDHAMYSDGFD